MPRSDAYPELVNYEDRGCSVAPRCLSCPLEVCRYDLPRHFRAHAQKLKNHAAIRQAMVASANPADLSAATGLSKRTIHRALKEWRG